MHQLLHLTYNYKNITIIKKQIKIQNQVKTSKIKYCVADLKGM
jgi:hypothetical protein